MTPQGPHLIYFADPMCSWCWAFAPVMDAIAAAHGARLPVRLILGGLRPGHAEPMTAARRDALAAHWAHVQQATGQPCDPAVLHHADFIYDTDPACRALVAMRRAGRGDDLAVLHALQNNFYAQSRDITRPDELAGIAASLGHDGAAVRAALDDPDIREETWRDYAISQATGVTGFPTLIAGPGGGAPYAVVARGYEQPGRILPALAQWLAGQARD